MRLHDKLNQVICDNPDAPRIVHRSMTVKQVYLYKKEGLVLGRVDGRIVRMLTDGVWFFMHPTDVPKNVTVH